MPDLGPEQGAEQLRRHVSVAHEQDGPEAAELEQEVERHVWEVRRRVGERHVGIDVGDGCRLFRVSGFGFRGSGLGFRV